jgi:hypothetical protein
VKQASHELEIVTGRAHDRGDRHTPRAQLQRRLDDDAIESGNARSVVAALDGDF